MFILLLAATPTACTSAPPVAVGDLPLTFQKDVALPGKATRLDYQALDPQTHQLYIAHLGDSTVDVVDVDTLAARTLPAPIASVHGLALASDQHLLLATASGSNEVVFIDTRTGRTVGRAPTGDTPDGIAYDPINGNAYISNEHDHSETVVNVATRKVVDTIDIGSEAGNTVYNPLDRTILINAQTTDELLTIDPAKNRIVSRIHLTGCDGNHGLYVDGATGLAYVACEGNATLLSVDMRSHKTIARFHVGQIPDVLAYDTSLSRLYVASESGVISIFQLEGRGLQELAQATLADGAHTVAVDQSSSSGEGDR